MCSFHGLQASSPSIYLAKEMLFLTPCPQYFVFSLNQSKCPYLCCTSSCLTSVLKNTWSLFLGINVLSYWDRVFFRSCPVPSHRRIHINSFPELELWTRILFLLNFPLVLSPFSPFPCTLQLYPTSESEQEWMENTLERGLCPYGGLTSISKLGRLSCTSFLPFVIPPSACAGELMAEHPKKTPSKQKVRVSLTNPYSNPSFLWPQPGKGLSALPISLAALWGWITEREGETSLRFLTLGWALSLHSAQEMWGHLWVSLISPDIDKIQPQPRVGPSGIAAVTQKIM